MSMIWKCLLLVLVGATFTLFVLGWLQGAADDWATAKPLFWIAFGCLITGITIFPLAVKKDGESYLGVLQKYLF